MSITKERPGAGSSPEKEGDGQSSAVKRLHPAMEKITEERDENYESRDIRRLRAYAAQQPSDYDDDKSLPPQQIDSMRNFTDSAFGKVPGA